MRNGAFFAFSATAIATVVAFGVSVSSSDGKVSSSGVKVEQSVSGLQVGDGIAEPNLPERGPTVLEPGLFVATVVEVVQSHEDRTDLHDGAEFPFEIRPLDESDDYIINRRLEIGGRDGRLRGEGTNERSDPDYACTATVELRVRGRVQDRYSFGLMVEEDVFINGPECDLSDLGPARAEENVYRMRVVAEEV